MKSMMQYGITGLERVKQNRGLYDSNLPPW